MDDSIEKQEYLNHDRLKKRTKMALRDISGRGNEVSFEINWNSLVRSKGYVKMTIGKHSAVVSREQLWAIMFMFGSAEEQEKLISPFVKQTRVTKYTRLLGVTTSRDIRKGELINVPLEFTFQPESGKITIGKGNLGAIRKSIHKEFAPG